MSVSWFKDGKPLKSEDKVKIGGEGEQFFVELSACDADTAGEYTCTASNVAGDACCTVNVIVTGAPYLSALMSQRMNDPNGNFTNKILYLHLPTNMVTQRKMNHEKRIFLYS